MIRGSLFPLALAFALAAISGSAAAQPCPAGNLVTGSHITGNGIYGNAEVIVDGRLATTGSPSVAPMAAVGSASANVIIDLGQKRTIRALFIQADASERYVVQGSMNGSDWRWAWKVEAGAISGLLTRFARIDEATRARYLAVRRLGGHGFFAVSEFAAFCQVPDPWPPEFVRAPPESSKPSSLLDIDRMAAIKTAVALSGLVFFLWGIVLDRAQPARTHPRLRNAALLALGLLAGACWWNLFEFRYGQYGHPSDRYHYYIGAKYFRELAYTRLYECTTVADLEDGLQDQVLGRRIRNLRTNRLEDTSAIVDDRQRCKQHFTPSRWESFKRDIRWFRNQVSPGHWGDMQHDHGFNATPVWTILGTALTNIAPASDRTILALTLLDPLILVVMWFSVYRVFGWRATCVALLWWGTNLPARYDWTGGSILRFDWLFFSIVGIALVKRRRMASGGAFLGIATLLRVFPGFIVIGLLLKAIMMMCRQRKLSLSPEHRRFVAGGLAALVVLAPLSFVTSGGPSAWSGFVENSRLHLNTPTGNRMGLKAVLSYDPEARETLYAERGAEDPFAKWREAKRRAFERRKSIFVSVLLAFAVLLTFAVERQEDWAALVLGIGLIVIAAEVGSYYYCILLGFGLLWHQWREIIGALLCALSAASGLASWLWGSWEEIHTWTSLAVVIFVFLVTALFLIHDPRVEGRARPC